MQASSSAKMWPLGMETIMRKAKVFDFLWGMFSYVDEEIDEEISKYDARNTELIIFGKRVYLDPDLVSRATNIPCRGGAILSSRKTRGHEKN